MKRVIMIHGWQGKPEAGWRPSVRSALEVAGFTVEVPAMPHPDEPVPVEWVEALSRRVGTPDEDTYLIGHSLGAVTILRYLATLSGDAAIGGAVFVAGFAGDVSFSGYNGELAAFFQDPLPWEEIRRHSGAFVAIHSDDDPLVEVENLQIFADKLGAITHLQHGGRHFGDEDNVKDLPIVVGEILTIAGHRQSRLT